MKVTKKELTRITGFPLVQLLPGAQTAYIIINLRKYSKPRNPLTQPFYLNTQSLQRLHGLQSLR